jgi:8-oxo-dGTP pyrophosphatase MutT (NUDIX family)
VRPDAPWPQLRARIVERLAPLSAYDPAAGCVASDYDLNPPFRPTAGGVLHPSAVLVPIVEHADAPTVLLTQRSADLTRHAGQVAFPGGRAEPGERPWETALRETQEEIGLEPGRVELAGLASPYETVTGFQVTPVVGFVRPGFELTVNASEVADVFEVPLAQLLLRESYERRSLEWKGAPRYFYAMPFEDRLIWGATAGMLRALHDRLFEEEAA